MDRLPTGEPFWELSYDEKGGLVGPLGGDAFLDEVSGANVVDLFVLCHGWGTSQQSANQLYDALSAMIAKATATAPGLGPIGFARIYWPSLWFPDSTATPPPATTSTQADGGAVRRAATGSASLTGVQIADSLLPGFTDAQQRATVEQLGALIDDGANAGPQESDAQKEDRLAHLNDLIRSLVPTAPNGTFEDTGETALLLTDDPVKAYQKAADVFGSASPGSSTQGLGDWFGKALGGLKDAVRVLSYTIMKARAGDIGHTGLGPVLASLHGQSAGVRVHLVGHSFGARLVAFSLSGIPDPATSPVASLVLLQGAFSHWSFAHAQDNPFGQPGALNTFADRVHGPLLATYTPYDWAICIWYPKASFLAGQSESATVADRWGGMGSDGYQAVTPAADLSIPAEGGLNYQLAAGTFHRVNGSLVINDVTGQPFAGAHSDIQKQAVADLIAAAATPL